MPDNPDPNLNDDDLIQAIAECEQGLLSGDSCSMCNAEWINHHLVHNPGCLFPIVLTMLETQGIIEAYLDAEAS